MALWRPYVDEAALDLSKSAEKNINETPASKLSTAYLCNDTRYTVPASVLVSPVSSGDSASISSSYETITPSYSTNYAQESSLRIFSCASGSSLDMDTLNEDPNYKAFESTALKAMAEKNGGKILVDNPRMRRALHSKKQDSSTDAYRTQREKNNIAAKQSRDRRRMKEINLCLKLTYLKSEIASLQSKVALRVCSQYNEYITTMSLPTSNVDEPLDLSLSVIKRERTLPAYEILPSGSPNYNYGRPQHASPNTGIYYLSYADQALVPSAYVSQASVDNIAHWSPPLIYESEAINHFQRYKPFGSLPSAANPPEEYDVESLDNDIEYQAFERDALQAMAEKNGGSLLGTNPRMRRIVHTNQAADDNYRRQREKNNFAAKQSRDKRRLREVRLALKVTFLKKKRDELRAMLAAGVCGRCYCRSV
ncbi:unnamed protein product [Diatraea saccharalis]|uniref:BZIP domain-containing protein n=1 Tax=Diatraea saccharalis TaxID=40085 RepID=A0A9N9R2T4_9NEOP|nr:unnamed protein product [Diatraea saccharalis]